MPLAADVAHAQPMFVVSEAEAAAIRTAYEQRGEFSAAMELRRLFPGITDNVQARECARTIASWRPLPKRLPPARPRTGKRHQPPGPDRVIDGLSMCETCMDWQELETFSFGDRPALADELAGLVLSGIKTATCWAAVEGLRTEPGKLTVMLGGNGRPLAVIETVELTLRRFDEVDASFAYDEGEDDRTLASGREAHRRYFSRLDQFSPEMMLYCERFRVLERL